MAKQVKSDLVESSELVVVDQSVGELAPADHSQNASLAFMPTQENIELLKESLSSSDIALTDSELGIFLYQAQRTGLDPLARQIYVMKRKQGGVSFMTSIDGQRLVAQRSGEYDGQTSPQWCGKDGKWREVWLEDSNPAAARVGVYRKGMREPVYGVATWKSYNQGRGVWGTMGDVMLAKCAEALALRKAFPQELAGLYTPEEMNSNDADAPAPPRIMSANEALAAAGKLLVEKGFTREEALTIITGIADVDDPAALTGPKLKPVLEIVNREDHDSLALYIPHYDSTVSDPPEAEVVERPKAEKSVSQAMADGDEEPPEDFAVPDEDLAKAEAETKAVTDAKEKLIADPPKYGRGKSTLPRPEMRKDANTFFNELGITSDKDREDYTVRVISKPKPTTFDDYDELIKQLWSDVMGMRESQQELVSEQ